MIQVHVLDVAEMLAKMRSMRGGTCTVIAVLVGLSLLLPVFFTGTRLSQRIVFDWFAWSNSSQEYAGYGNFVNYDIKASRLQSSCPLKVYAYDMPRKFNFGLLEKDDAPDQDLPWGEDEPLPSWPLRSGLRKQHNVEYWLTVDLFDRHVGFEGERAVVRVQDPEEADLFFVPFFSSLSFNKFGSFMRDPEAEKDRILQEEVVSILFQSEWWRRSGGRDHVLAVHHPNAFRFCRHLINSSIFIVADFGRNPPAVSSLKKDVVAPYTHVLPSYKNDDAEDPFEIRTTLLYFQGKIKRKDDGIVRTQLADLLQNKTGVHFEEGAASAEGLEEATIGMRSSLYCLHPAGDTPSSCRLFDAIVSHCVPVIISDKIELPFEDELNYNSFALFFSVEEALRPGWLLTQLRSVDKESWLKMFHKLKEVSHHFEFQHPTKQDDAVNMIWKELHHKVPAIKLASHRTQRLKISDWWR
ncbi:unnamed protein product [Calypogeia fissa]